MLTITDILKGKVIILCIGNTERGDDGAGPHLAGMIRGKVKYDVIDAGVSPENWTGVITRLKPDTIIIVDAVFFDGEPGDVRVFSGEELRQGKISTHDMSPGLLIEYLKGSTNAGIYMIGIKSQANKFGASLSPCVKSSLNAISAALILHSNNVKVYS